MAVEAVSAVLSGIRVIVDLNETCKNEDAEIGAIATKLDTVVNPLKNWARSQEPPLGRDTEETVRTLMFSMLCRLQLLY